MPPAMGRPIKGDQRRDRSLQIRLSESEMKDLDECASRMNVPRTDVISQGIRLVKAELGKEKG